MEIDINNTCWTICLGHRETLNVRGLMADEHLLPFIILVMCTLYSTCWLLIPMFSRTAPKWGYKNYLAEDQGCDQPTPPPVAEGIE